MKTTFLTYIFFLLSISLIAQSTYEEALAMGDQAFKKEQYRNALNYYFAAEAFDPTKKVIVKKKISDVFDKIEQLKNNAQKAESKAKKAIEEQRKAIDAQEMALKNMQIAQINENIAKQETEKALYHLDSINKKNQKLIDAFYFYDSKYALSIKTVAGRSRYGFINRNAEPIIPHVYQEASLFDKKTGFSKAIKRGAPILLDTMGREYDVAYTVEDLEDYTLALDLRDEPLDSFPMEVFKYPQLQIIILSCTY